MTVMAAEAGASAFEGEAADSAAAGRRATSRPRRAQRAAPAPAARSGGQQRASQGRGGGNSRSFPGGGKASKSNYHGAILAEWLLAFLLVAAIPFAKPNQTGVSPYAGRDMVQLGTLTIVYWLLAIVAATGRTQARFAAWFGGLILLAVGLAEASNIASAVSTWLGGAASTATTASSAAGTPDVTTGNASVVNAPSTETATGISRAVAQQQGSALPT